MNEEDLKEFEKLDEEVKDEVIETKSEPIRTGGGTGLPEGGK